MTPATREGIAVLVIDGPGRDDVTFGHYGLATGLGSVGDRIVPMQDRPGFYHVLSPWVRPCEIRGGRAWLEVPPRPAWADRPGDPPADHS